MTSSKYESGPREGGMSESSFDDMSFQTKNYGTLLPTIW